MPRQSEPSKAGPKVSERLARRSSRISKQKNLERSETSGSGLEPNEKNDNESDVEMISDSDTRSRSSSVSSDSSYTSSSSSSSSRIVIRSSQDPSKEQFPYCVLNAIPEHLEVEHALFSILESMTDDPNFTLGQSHFGFLLGYSTYCLVVGNGCKQNVISRMTIGDFRRARFDEPSGLHCFSFSSKSTCSQKETVEYLCADERIWRALEIYEAARDRRIKEMNWSELDSDNAPFFVSFVSPAAIMKDTNYPMTQFLRMCGIDWPCRSSAICSAAWSLVRRDSAKASHQQYAITCFKLLREKENSQVQLLEDGLSGHPTYQKIETVEIAKAKRQTERQPRKKQKRYTTPERRGLPNKPRGGDHKSIDFLKRTGRPIPEKKKKEDDGEPDTRQEINEEESSSSNLNSETFESVPTLLPSSRSFDDSSQQFPEYRIEAEGDYTLTCL